MDCKTLLGVLLLTALLWVPLTAAAEGGPGDTAGVAVVAAGEAAQDARPARAWWIRYPGWLFLGLLGGFGLGLLINKRMGGLGCLVPIWGLAVWSIVVSYRLGHSLIPPIACIVVTVLLSGVAARAGRVGREMAEKRR